MSKKELNVAITGNAPFLDWDFNTSLMVRDALPEIIEREDKSRIHVRKFARVTHDTYDDVRSVSKAIWNGKRSEFLPEPKDAERDQKVDIDFILHLGMEIRDEQKFGFETRARRDGYEKSGDDGKPIDSKHLADLGLPEVLTTSFDVDAAWKKVYAELPDVPCVVSDDAGLYFCEFRLYSSLAEALQHHPEKEGRVLFQHIPLKHDDEAIQLATKLTEAYIKALADDKSITRT